MYYCSELYSLSVLSLYEGEILGIVDKLYFDKSLKKLVEIELLNEEGVRLTLNTKNIYKVGKNAITVKNNQEVNVKVESTDLTLCPIGSKTYSINGEYLGILKEISLKNNFLTEKVSLDNNEILQIKNLASCGKNTIIFNDNNSKVDVKKFIPKPQPKEFKNEEVQVAQILPSSLTEKEKTKEVVNSDFLIGRICIKDIYNFNNELLIKANDKVNKKNLKELKKFGKIRELMLFCK